MLNKLTYGTRVQVCTKRGQRYSSYYITPGKLDSQKRFETNNVVVSYEHSIFLLYADLFIFILFEYRQRRAF